MSSHAQHLAAAMKKEDVSFNFNLSKLSYLFNLFSISTSQVTGELPTVNRPFATNHIVDLN